jgi:hypothetical protein
MQNNQSCVTITFIKPDTWRRYQLGTSFHLATPLEMLTVPSTTARKSLQCFLELAEDGVWIGLTFQYTQKVKCFVLYNCMKLNLCERFLLITPFLKFFNSSNGREPKHNLLISNSRS